jgi:MFS family permease
LTLLLILEGVGFGVFLVTGQTAVARASGQTNRGAAVGLFWMAGAIGDTAGPIGLGVVAQVFGLVAVFQTVAAAVLVSAVLVVGLGTLAAIRVAREPAPVR